MSHTTPEKELKSLGPAQFMGRRIKRLSFSSTVKSVSYTVRYFLYLGFLVLFIGFAGQNLLLVSSFREVLLDVSAPLFNIVDGPIEGIESTGASRLQTIWFAVVPQVAEHADHSNHFPMQLTMLSLQELSGSNHLPPSPHCRCKLPLGIRPWLLMGHDILYVLPTRVGGHISAP